MPPEALDFRERTHASELMDEPASRETMLACLRDLAWVNRCLFAYRPTLSWLDSLGLESRRGPVRILDVACGYGDMLRRIEHWASRRGIQTELTGLDLNPDTVAIAADASDQASRIRWVSADVFSYRAEPANDLIVSSQFTHHLPDADVVKFVGWMEQNATLGWFINDLSRAPIPYHLFRWFSRAMRLHTFVQHDGPVSIARSFVPAEWLRLCAAAGLRADQIEILHYKPARLCVSRRKAL